jgi:hypothetical protein
MYRNQDRDTSARVRVVSVPEAQSIGEADLTEGDLGRFSRSRLRLPLRQPRGRVQPKPRPGRCSVRTARNAQAAVNSYLARS